MAEGYISNSFFQSLQSTCIVYVVRIVFDSYNRIATETLFPWRALLYRSDCWTLGKREKSYLEAAEAWTTKTIWTDEKSNAEVLRRIKKRKLKEIEMRKIKLLSHLISHKGLGNISEGKLSWRKEIGRLRDDIRATRIRMAVAASTRRQYA